MLLKRFLTVLIGAPIVIGVIIFPNPILFKIFVTVCLAFAMAEFFSIVGLVHRERVWAIILGILHIIFLLFIPEGTRRLSLEISFILIAIFSFYCLTSKTSLEGIAQKIAMTSLGVLYIGTFGSFVGLLREFPFGIFWVFVVLAMTWLNDTFAYFFGHRFGRHKLAPLVSPGKTWEGFFGGYLGSFCGFFLFWFLLPNNQTLLHGLILTLLVGTVGPLGDLCESIIKRSFRVKDSGNIIPGHGGMLDRIDALLFTAPVVYGFALLFSR